MPRTYMMSYRKNERRWRKKHHGRVKNFPLLVGERKTTSYERCWKTCQRWMEQIDREDAAAKVDPAVRRWERNVHILVDRMMETAADDSLEARQEHVRLHTQLLNLYRAALPFDPERDLPDDPGFWQDDAAVQRATTELWEDKQNFPTIPEREIAAVIPPLSQIGAKSIPAKDTIGGHLDRYLAGRQAESDAGQLSRNRVVLTRRYLTEALEVIGLDREIEAFNAKGCDAIYEFILAQMKPIGKKKQRWAPHTAKEVLTFLKAFADWAADQELIEYPMRLKKRKIRVGRVEKEYFEKKELSAMLSAAPERTRLYLLLMLNTGCQQSDICELKHTDVNWRKRTVTIRRNKTERYPNVPEVTYPLWPETFLLLKKHRSKHPELVLVGTTGNPLKSGRGESPGDTIRCAYNTLTKRTMGIANRKPLKLIRKTASNELHKKYPYHSNYFLGHAPGDITTRHYVGTDQKQFAEAVLWLGTQFNLGN